ncbi:serine carboxypeptidase-like 18 [Quercus suber]|uniref:serine carboxypeptidase-like 18 n=1 Tax=Quercus suber TaxID=58331 RepID=UPI000CE1A5E8|nr:serine carboxypeptidase-like 18 isoform X2 [Quercus suber]POF06519.1 serine carboxypeptidase-like 18 [Quercus suber]
MANMATESIFLKVSCVNGKYVGLMCVHVLLVLLLSSIATSSKTILDTLPGYPGTLPFKLETGYVAVGEIDDLELFYYFVESQRNPVRDPLVLWLTGGPGCSALSGLLYEIGPLTFDYAAFNGSRPTLVQNPYSWTEVANVIFLDAPVGTGFSYSHTQEGYYSSDTESPQAIYLFLRKWLLDHPRYIKNPLYIAGDSYSGVIVPQVTLLISNGNRDGSVPPMSLLGYMLGNPVTDQHGDQNSRVKYFHRLTLISDELYESIKAGCNEEYVDPDINNSTCIDDIGLVAECTIRVNDAHILEPKCSFATPRPKTMNWGRKFFDDIPDEIIQSPTKREEKWCRNSNYVLSYMWANDQTVQNALGVRNGTITDWKRCNKSLAYDSNLRTVVHYHDELLKRGYRALIYSGDHDMMIPYVGTLAWINFLNMTMVDGWRPWTVDGQIAGFTEKYARASGDGLTFATVKGGGHTAPEYKPKECLEMADRWMSFYGL